MYMKNMIVIQVILIVTIRYIVIEAWEICFIKSIFFLFCSFIGLRFLFLNHYAGVFCVSNQVHWG